MDIAKIRKKIKQGGGHKVKATKGKSKKEPSAQDSEAFSETDNATNVEMSKNIISPLKDENAKTEEITSDNVIIDDGEEYTPSVELLVFNIANQDYAFRIEDVQEILRNQPITAVPGTTSFLLGITSLRGIIIPVMDLYQRLNIKVEHLYEKRTKILVVSGQKGNIGILVRSAAKVKAVPVDLITTPPESLNDDEVRFIGDVARLNGRFVFIINIDELLNFNAKVEAR